MIVKREDETKVVSCPNGGFVSHRYLLDSDNMGFTMTKTVIPAGSIENWHYKNHLEACLCISGVGSVRLKHGLCDDVHRIEPGVMYALNKHDNHIFTAFTDVVLICVFNPPLTGNEVHQQDGSYSKRGM